MVRRAIQGALIALAVLLLAFAWRCDPSWFDRHVFLPQQFFIVANTRIVTVVRFSAIAVAALLLVVSRFVPVGISARRLVFAVLLAVAAAEGLLQLGVRHLVRRELVETTEALTTWHPRYGLTLAPSIDRVQPMSGRDIRFRTDADRRRTSGIALDEALPSLVFTGESTVAGYGLQWEETFAAIVGARLHLQVVNLGSLAYRLDQSWLRLNDQLPRVAHPVAVIGLFMPGLVGRSFAGQRHPLARPSPSGRIELRPAEAPRLLRSSGLYRMWKHLYWSDASLQEGMLSVAAVLRDMDALAKARGAPCIFVVTGRTPQWMVHDIFQANALDYVEVDVPEDELLADGHPGPQASIRIASALEPRLLEALRAR